MFKRRDIVSAIELASSKICILVGACSDDAPLTIIGQSEVPVDSEIVKGEVVDMNTVLEKLSEALAIADVSSSHENNYAVLTAISVTGCNISSHQESATVFIKENTVSVDDVREAQEIIARRPAPNSLEKLNMMDSYYLLDGVRRVRNPVEQNASRLELFSHVVFGDANRIGNFRSAYAEAGFEDSPLLIFAPLADLCGVVSQEERERGVLLVDMGRGATEYVASFNGGVFASGVVPVGMDHVANDLAIGLRLPMDVCRNLLVDNTLKYAASTGSGIVELPLPSGVRRIPLASFEKIIDLRLRETFGIIKSAFFDVESLRSLQCGGVLTGGGALFGRTAGVFQSVFDFPVRIGRPYDRDRDLGAIADPRYSTLWGTLLFAEEQLSLFNEGRKHGVMPEFSDFFSKVGDSVWRKISGIRHSIKI